MRVRPGVKVILQKDGKLLLHRYRYPSGEICYELPGGGQNGRESALQAVRREVLEETGLEVEVTGFLTSCEEFLTDERLLRAYPEYAHRLILVFSAQLSSPVVHPATEMDLGQQESIWLTPQEADRLPVRPACLAGQFTALLRGECPGYLGVSCYPEITEK